MPDPQPSPSSDVPPLTEAQVQVVFEAIEDYMTDHAIERLSDYGYDLVLADMRARGLVQGQDEGA